MGSSHACARRHTRACALARLFVQKAGPGFGIIGAHCTTSQLRAPWRREETIETILLGAILGNHPQGLSTAFTTFLYLRDTETTPEPNREAPALAGALPTCAHPYLPHIVF